MNYIYLAGVVDVAPFGDITLDSVRAAIESVRADDPAAPVTLVLNSPGGDVIEGLAIYNYLRRAKVNVEISGMAASIASIIAMAGEHIAIYDNSMIFVHHAWSYLGDGNAADARSAADRMDAVDAMLATVYASRGLSSETITEIMDGPDGQGTMIPASRALELGLVDEVLDPALAAAAFLKNYQPHPRNTQTNQQEEPPMADPEEPTKTVEPEDACSEPEKNAVAEPEKVDTPDETEDLKAEIEDLKAQLAEAKSQVEQRQKLAASIRKAHTEPAPAQADEWPALVKKHGYAAARAKYPEIMNAYCEKELAKGSIH